MVHGMNSGSEQSRSFTITEQKMLYSRKKTIFVNFRNNTVVMRKASGGGKHRREFHCTDFKMLEKGGMETIVPETKGKNNSLAYSPTNSSTHKTDSDINTFTNSSSTTASSSSSSSSTSSSSSPSSPLCIPTPTPNSNSMDKQVRDNCILRCTILDDVDGLLVRTWRFESMEDRDYFCDLLQANILTRGRAYNAFVEEDRHHVGYISMASVYDTCTKLKVSPQLLFQSSLQIKDLKDLHSQSVRLTSNSLMPLLPTNQFSATTSDDDNTMSRNSISVSYGRQSSMIATFSSGGPTNIAPSAPTHLQSKKNTTGSNINQRKSIPDNLNNVATATATTTTTTVTSSTGNTNPLLDLTTDSLSDTYEDDTFDIHSNPLRQNIITPLKVESMDQTQCEFLDSILSSKNSHQKLQEMIQSTPLRSSLIGKNNISAHGPVVSDKVLQKILQNPAIATQKVSNINDASTSPSLKPSTENNYDYGDKQNSIVSVGTDARDNYPSDLSIDTSSLPSMNSSVTNTPLSTHSALPTSSFFSTPSSTNSNSSSSSITVTAGNVSNLSTSNTTSNISTVPIIPSNLNSMYNTNTPNSAPTSTSTSIDLANTMPPPIPERTLLNGYVPKSTFVPGNILTKDRRNDLLQLLLLVSAFRLNNPNISLHGNPRVSFDHDGNPISMGHNHTSAIPDIDTISSHDSSGNKERSLTISSPVTLLSSKILPPALEAISFALDIQFTFEEFLITFFDVCRSIAEHIRVPLFTNDPIICYLWERRVVDLTRNRPQVANRFNEISTSIQTSVVDLLHGEVVLLNTSEVEMLLSVPSAATCTGSEAGRVWVFGSLVLTSYRLVFRSISAHLENSACEIPVASILSIESTAQPDSGISSNTTMSLNRPGSKQMIIRGRDGRKHYFSFDSSSLLNELHSMLLKLAYPIDQTKLFAFMHRWPLFDVEGFNLIKSHNGWGFYKAEREYTRLGFTHDHHLYRWCVANRNYAISSTYPSLFIVPRQFSDMDVSRVCAYRSRGRLPVPVYMHPKTGATISRCAQPLVGLKGKDSSEDAMLLTLLREANPSNKSLIHLLDARPMAAAYGNKLMGKGVESVGKYSKAELEFLDIDNIHAISRSYNDLTDLITSFSNSGTGTGAFSSFHERLANTRWLSYLCLVLRGASKICQYISEEGSSVITHCSDGWDRTSQICALAELFMDPYYRTRIGFAVLIEKEWLSFGHQFASRIGHASGEISSERSPIFVQFIDCVYQVMRQYPHSFEFNEAFLLYILDSLYSSRFGTFLFNTERERVEQCLSFNTTSLWTYICHPTTAFEFCNTAYDSKIGPIYLKPDCTGRRIFLWEQYYLRHTVFQPAPNQTLQHGVSRMHLQITKLLERCMLHGIDIQDIDPIFPAPISNGTLLPIIQPSPATLLPLETVGLNNTGLNMGGQGGMSGVFGSIPMQTQDGVVNPSGGVNGARSMSNNSAILSGTNSAPMRSNMNSNNVNANANIAIQPGSNAIARATDTDSLPNLPTVNGYRRGSVMFNNCGATFIESFANDMGLSRPPKVDLNSRVVFNTIDSDGEDGDGDGDGDDEYLDIAEDPNSLKSNTKSNVVNDQQPQPQPQQQQLGREIKEVKREIPPLPARNTISAPSPSLHPASAPTSGSTSTSIPPPNFNLGANNRNTTEQQRRDTTTVTRPGVPQTETADISSIFAPSVPQPLKPYEPAPRLTGPSNSIQHISHPLPNTTNTANTTNATNPTNTTTSTIGPPHRPSILPPPYNGPRMTVTGPPPQSPPYIPNPPPQFPPPQRNLEAEEDENLRLRAVSKPPPVPLALLQSMHRNNTNIKPSQIQEQATQGQGKDHLPEQVVVNARASTTTTTMTIDDSDDIDNDLRDFDMTSQDYPFSNSDTIMTQISENGGNENDGRKGSVVKQSNSHSPSPSPFAYSPISSAPSSPTNSYSRSSVYYASTSDLNRPSPQRDAPKAPKSRKSKSGSTRKVK